MPYLTGLIIRQCRNIEELDISIPDRDEAPTHLILTGPNGSGKTGVLEGLTHVISRLEEYNLLLRATGITTHYPQKNQTTTRHQTDKKREQIMTDLGFNVRPLFETAGQAQQIEVYTFIPARRSFTPNIVDGFPKARPKRFHPLSELVGNDLAQVLAHLRIRAALESESGDTAARDTIYSWLEHFQTILRDLHEDPNLQLKMDSRTYEHTITRGSGHKHSLSELAHGHAAALAVIAEIFVRVYDANPDAVIPQDDPEGIVIIDEVEAHLHLSLQEKLLPWLCDLFPRVQFVVSTHSPVVIASLPDAYVFDLGTRTGHLSADYQGIPYGTIMKFHFGLSHDYDLETSRELERLVKLLDAPDGAAHQEEIDALDATLSRKSASLAALVWRLRKGLESKETI